MENKRYVKLLPGWSTNGEFVGEIFDTEKDFQNQFKKFTGITRSWDWIFILSEPNHSDHFVYVSEKDFWKQELSNGKLVKYGYYTVKETGVVFRYDGTQKSYYHIGISMDSKDRKPDCFCKENGGFDSDNIQKDYRLADDFEIEWLEACNEADEFITKKEFEKAYNTEKQKEMVKTKTTYQFKKGLWSDHLEKNKILKDIVQIGLIHDQMVDPDEKEVLKALESPYVREHFERLNVMDLWFTKKETQINPFKFGDWITFMGKDVVPSTISYTTRYEGVDKEGWVQSTINCPDGGNYHFQHYRFATSKEIEFLESIIIEGYTVIVKEGYVKVGCKAIKYSEVEVLMKFIHAGLKVEYSEEIKKVWERLNK